MKRKFAAVVSFLAVTILLFSLNGCSGQNRNADEDVSSPASGQTETEKITPSPAPSLRQNETPETLPSGAPAAESGTYNPLTGLPMDKKYLNRRPVAVMLNNIKKAQPQLGVSKADIIYEIPAEGGVTRLLALYQEIDQAGTLGSIRSARPYYLEIALGHDALLVHAGGSEEAYQDIQKWSMDNMDGVRGGSDAKIFWRDPDRRKNMGYEHSMLTSGEKIQEYLDAGYFRTDHRSDYSWYQTYTDAAAPSGGRPAEKITIQFTGGYKTGIFQYDAKTGKYLASQYGKPHVDGINGEQVSTDNLLVLDASMEVLDKEGRLAVNLTGTGNGIYCCRGSYIPIRWEKTNRNSPFRYYRQNGQPLALAAGKTYVCITDPESSTVTIEPSE